MSRKPTEPQFIIAPGFGVSIDTYNFTLLRQSGGAKKTWKAAGYYSKLDALLKGFAGELLRQDYGETSLLGHINAAQAAVNRFWGDFEQKVGVSIPSEFRGPDAGLHND